MTDESAGNGGNVAAHPLRRGRDLPRDLDGFRRIGQTAEELAIENLEQFLAVLFPHRRRRDLASVVHDEQRRHGRLGGRLALVVVRIVGRRTAIRIQPARRTRTKRRRDTKLRHHCLMIDVSVAALSQKGSGGQGEQHSELGQSSSFHMVTIRFSII
jgi:hypothetical protein